MPYTPLKRDYQMRSAMGGWRFTLKHRFKNGPCPYWRGHAGIKRRLLNNLLFEKWLKRPQSAYKLYWRLHPEEFKAANEWYKTRKM